MSQLDPKKLHVNLRRGATPAGLYGPRRYTLTHSDATGDLFLTIGLNYDNRQVSGIYTRLMRDEVLAEWKEDENGPALHVYCHVSGGLILGTAGWRYGIFKYHLPMVLEAFRFGDRPLFEAHPDLDQAPVRVHFHSGVARYNKVEDWGKLENYLIYEAAKQAAEYNTSV
jgi:Staygreen protein